MDLKYLIPKVLKKIFHGAAIRNSKLDKTSRVDIGSIVNHAEVGRYSYVGEHSSVLYTRIGQFTSISNYCAIGGGGHPLEWVSTSPVFTASKSILNAHLAMHEYTPFQETVIGNDVWIGSHCLIKAGVHIGDGAVIGMGSVVTKDVGAYEIWAGNPARMIRKRFDDQMVDALLDIEWWAWPEGKIRKYADYMNDPSAFVNALKNEVD